MRFTNITFKSWCLYDDSLFEHFFLFVLHSLFTLDDKQMLIHLIHPCSMQ
jgi:hypothetical protein